MARTERESDRRREEKWQTCWCCRNQQRACRMAPASAEKLEHTGPTESKKVAAASQREQLQSTPGPPLPKGKRTKRLSKAPDNEEAESHDGREHEEVKGELLREGRKIPRRTGRANKKSLLRSRRKHERVSGRKSSPGRSAESWFHSKSGQTWSRKESREMKSSLIQ